MTVHTGFCLAVAEDLGQAIANPNVTRSLLLYASPRVVERSGRVKTLIEMLEQEAGDSAYLARLARLLLRSIQWR